MLTSPATGPIPTRPLHIGDVAELTGLSLRSIRHYEEIGLVTPQGRTTGGFRLYDAEAVERLRLVMDLKILGLSLDQIRPIVDSCLALEEDRGSREDVELVSESQARISAALAEIEQRLQSARHLGKRLDDACRAAAAATRRG